MEKREEIVKVLVDYTLSDVGQSMISPLIYDIIFKKFQKRATFSSKYMSDDEMQSVYKAVLTDLIHVVSSKLFTDKRFKEEMDSSDALDSKAFAVFSKVATDALNSYIKDNSSSTIEQIIMRYNAFKKKNPNKKLIIEPRIFNKQMYRLLKNTKMSSMAIDMTQTELKKDHFNPNIKHQSKTSTTRINPIVLNMMKLRFKYDNEAESFAEDILSEIKEYNTPQKQKDTAVKLAMSIIYAGKTYEKVDADLSGVMEATKKMNKVSAFDEIIEYIINHFEEEDNIFTSDVSSLAFDETIRNVMANLIASSIKGGCVFHKSLPLYREDIKEWLKEGGKRIFKPSIETRSLHKAFIMDIYSIFTEISKLAESNPVVKYIPSKDFWSAFEFSEEGPSIGIDNNILIFEGKPEQLKYNKLTDDVENFVGDFTQILPIYGDEPNEKNKSSSGFCKFMYNFLALDSINAANSNYFI